MGLVMKSALQQHREALVLRAQRLQAEREERKHLRKEREAAEQRATGMIVKDNGGPVAEALANLTTGDRERKGRLKFW